MAAKGLNQVELIGNLTRDPELKTAESGKKYCQFGMATNRSWKDKDGNPQTEVTFHNITCFDKLAEIVTQYLKKGSKIWLYGRIQTSPYIKNNETRTISRIIMTDIIMLDKKIKELQQPEPTEEEVNGTLAPEDIDFESEDQEPLAF